MLFRTVLLVAWTEWMGAYAAMIPFDDWEHQRGVLKDVKIHFRYAVKGPPLLLVHGFS